MPFLDEMEDVRWKIPGQGLPKPALAGIACVAVIIVAIVAVGVFSTARGDFTVDYGASSPSAATVTVASTEADPSADTSGATSGESESTSATSFVYVVGAVKEPGVYELEADSRVAEAIEAAGGFAKKADRAAVNLARPIVDGEQITIPKEGEGEPVAGGASAAEQPSVAQGIGVSTDGKVNINTAGSAELQSLPGVGEATAAKIIASRESEGAFASCEDLKRVSGIGEKKYAALADLITV